MIKVQVMLKKVQLMLKTTAPTKKPPKWRFICWRTHQDSNLRPLPPEDVRTELK
jgi:hypothetical protein